MAAGLLASHATAGVIRFSVTDVGIAELRDRYAGLSADTSKGYEAVRLAIAECRCLRGAVEQRRVELKADALAWSRTVDAEAKRITGLLYAIEDPLKAQKDAIDAEKERRRQEVIEAKRLELEAQIRAEREAEEVMLRAAREAEEERLRAARVADEERLAAERARLEAERRLLEDARRKADADDAARRDQARRQHEAEEATLRAEREALDADRRKVQAERERAEREEFERQTRIRAEREATERVERERIEKAKRDAEFAALRPDVEKVAAYADKILALSEARPKVKSRKVAALLAITAQTLSTLATDLKVQVTHL